MSTKLNKVALITGITGQDGSYLAELLLEKGYELKIIKGAKNTLKKTHFVIAEVRHNHQSFSSQYKLHEFIDEMHKNDFILSMILTAKPLIADLCFEKKSNLR